MELGFGIDFGELYTREGLQRVDASFMSELVLADAGTWSRLSEARRDPAGLGAKAESQLLLDLAPHVDDFTGALFGISAQVRALAERHHTLAPLFVVKRQFVQRRAVKAFDDAALAAIDGPGVTAALESLRTPCPARAGSRT